MEEIRRGAGYGNRTVEVVLQFSGEPRDAVAAQESVKAVLMLELKEQLKQYSGCERGGWL